MYLETKYIEPTSLPQQFQVLQDNNKTVRHHKRQLKELICYNKQLIAMDIPASTKQSSKHAAKRTSKHTGLINESTIIEESKSVATQDNGAVDCSQNRVIEQRSPAYRDRKRRLKRTGSKEERVLLLHDYISQ